MSLRKPTRQVAGTRGWLDSPPPSVAVEIAASGVLAARVRSGQPGGIAWEAAGWRALPSGAVQPGLVNANVPDPAVLTAALRQSLEAAGGAGREAALVLPDLAFRVTLLAFDEIPHHREELEALVRFRLRKTLPFDADQAALGVEVQRSGPERSVVAVLADRARLSEYENAFTAAGGRAATVMPAGLAALMALSDFGRGALLLRWHGGALTSGFGWRELPRLYRVLAADDLTYDDLHASAAYFRDFHEAQSERAPSPLPPRIFTFGIPGPLTAQLRDECAWAAVQAGAGALGQEEAYVALAGALAPAAGGEAQSPAGARAGKAVAAAAETSRSGTGASA